MNTSALMQLIIEAKNNASPDLEYLGKQVGGLNKGFGAMANGAVAVGAALAAIQGARLAFDLGRASAESLRLAESFELLSAQAGESGRAMLASMREASRGTIDDTALIQSANQAMLLEVAKGADDMTKLLEVASARGKATGRSAQEALGDIVVGIGRMSPQILDNLGIIVDAEAAFAAYGASVGKAAADLSEAEKKAALLNATYEATIPLIEAQRVKGGDLAESFERMDANISNAKDALGLLFTSAAAAIAEALAVAAGHVADQAARIASNHDAANAWKNAGEAMRFYKGEIEAWKAQMNDANPIVRAMQNSHLEYLETQLAGATAAREGAAAQQGFGAAVAALYGPLSDLSGQAALAAGATDGLTASNRAAATVEAQRAGVLRELNAELSTNRAIQGIGEAVAGQLKGSFKGVVGNLGAQGANAAYNEANATLQRQIEIWAELGMDQTEIEFMAAQYVDRITDANSELKKVVTTTKEVDQATKDAERAFEELTGKVQGILSGALDTGTGVDPSKFLPRPDDINEDARRLADVVVNGFDSPWADYLNTKFPELFKGAFDGGDLKGAAAQALADFQDGLRPELLDKDTAKERVKRMLLGEANMAELAAEIAAELTAEMGGQFSPEQIQAAAGAALGTAAPEGGNALGEGMVAGVNGQGKKVIEAMAADLKKSFDALEDQGKLAGKVWGSGFTSTVGENVPPQLINILTTLVTPEVYARLQEQGSLTEAES